MSFLALNYNPPRKSTSIYKKYKDPLNRSKNKIRQSWGLKTFENFRKFLKILKKRKFFENLIFRKLMKFLWKSCFRKISMFFEKFQSFSKFSRSQLWRILFFDLLNETFWFFLWIEVDFRGGFELSLPEIRIKIHWEKLFYIHIYLDP